MNIWEDIKWFIKSCWFVAYVFGLLLLYFTWIVLFVGLFPVIILCAQSVISWGFFIAYVAAVIAIYILMKKVF